MHRDTCPHTATWSGGLVPESSEGSVLHSYLALNPLGLALSSAQWRMVMTASLQRSQTSTPQAACSRYPGQRALLAPAGVPGRGPEMPASPVSPVSVSESRVLLVQRKLHLGSRGLSKREVAERGHFSKFDLVCFRKFSSFSTGQHFHLLSISRSILGQKEPDSGSLCSRG